MAFGIEMAAGRKGERLRWCCGGEGDPSPRCFCVVCWIHGSYLFVLRSVLILWEIVARADDCLPCNMVRRTKRQMVGVLIGPSSRCSVGTNILVGYSAGVR